MKKAERDAILRQGVVLPETPRQRRELAALAEDLETIELTGQAAPRPRTPLPPERRGLPRGHARAASLHAPPPRDRAAHCRRGGIGARGMGDARARAARATPTASAARGPRPREAWSFDELNDLIDRHNRWYPVESRLPMDPRRGDFALVNGRDYRLERARRRLGARALPGRPQLGSGLLALTIVSMASRSSPSTSRSTVVGLLDLEPGKLRRGSRPPCRGCPGRSAHRRPRSGSRGRVRAGGRCLQARLLPAAFAWTAHALVDGMCR